MALRFLAMTEETFASLAEHPGFGRERRFVRPGLAGIRSFRVRGFPNYLVFYFQRDSGIEIVRVLHGARDLESIFEADE